MKGAITMTIARFSDTLSLALAALPLFILLGALA